ncbi:MAG: hypothetical protein FLDDKLPJ_02316 [Phycisphaerae bacterium]|nr:hypothetical protein [Phycisphaerae bacterium]
MINLRSDVDAVVPFGPTSATRAYALSATIASLVRAGLPEDNITVVVNGLRDGVGSGDLAYCRSRYPTTRTLHSEIANRAIARNLGVGTGTRPFILFCDADTVPTPEAVQLVAAHVTPDTFVCGAHRRYVPFSTPSEDILRCIDEDRWPDLDALSSDEPGPTGGLRQGFRRRLHQVTFIGAFGAMSRQLFTQLGGFSESFLGWGLEDTDLMRRAFARCNFRSLAPTIVYHLDHLVSPYKWDEHWGHNWRNYCDLGRDLGFFRVATLFTRDYFPASDTEVLIPKAAPISLSDTVGGLPLESALRERLLSFAKAAMDSRDTAGLVLYGSGRYKRKPADLDLIRVVFPEYVNRFNFQRDGTPPIDEHQISLTAVETTITLPERNRDYWPWLAGHYADGILLAQRANLLFLLPTLLNETLSRRGHHLITFHLGRTLHLIAERDELGRGEAIRHAAALFGLAAGKWPASTRAPFFRDRGLRCQVDEFAAMLDSGQESALYGRAKAALIPPAMQALRTFKLADHSGPCFFPESDRALCELKRSGLSLSVEWRDTR